MLEDDSVDVCFSSNFFEHLPSKEVMDQVLSEARRVLKPGGKYLAMQPNIRCEPGKYWDYYDHVLPLTHMSCREAFIKAGFEVTDVVERFIPFSTDSKLPQHPLLVKIYLRIPLLWRIFRRAVFSCGACGVVLLGVSCEPGDDLKNMVGAFGESDLQ